MVLMKLDSFGFSLFFSWIEHLPNHLFFADSVEKVLRKNLYENFPFNNETVFFSVAGEALKNWDTLLYDYTGAHQKRNITK